MGIPRWFGLSGKNAVVGGLMALLACSSSRDPTAYVVQRDVSPSECTYEVFEDDCEPPEEFTYWASLLPGFSVVRAGVYDWRESSIGLWQFNIPDTYSYASSAVAMGGDNTEFWDDNEPFTDNYIDTPKPDDSCSCLPDLEDHDGWLPSGGEGQAFGGLHLTSTHILADPPGGPRPIIIRPPARIVRPNSVGVLRGGVALDAYIAHLGSSTDQIVKGTLTPKFMFVGGGLHGAVGALWTGDGLSAQANDIVIHTGFEGPIWMQMGGPGGQRRMPRLGLKPLGDPGHVPEHEIDYFGRENQGPGDFWDKAQIGEVTASISSSFPVTRMRVVSIKPRIGGDFETGAEYGGALYTQYYRGAVFNRGIGTPNKLSRRILPGDKGQIDLTAEHLPSNLALNDAVRLADDHIIVSEQIQMLASALNRLSSSLKANGIEPKNNAEYKALYDQARRLVAGKKVLVYGGGPNLVWALEDLYFGTDTTRNVGTLIGRKASGLWVVARKSAWDDLGTTSVFGRDGDPSGGGINAQPGRVNKTMKALDAAIAADPANFNKVVMPNDPDANILDVKLIKDPVRVRYRVTFGTPASNQTETFDTVIVSLGYVQTWDLYSATGGMGPIPPGKARFKLVTAKVVEGANTVERVVGLQAQVFDGDKGTDVPIFVGSAEAFTLVNSVGRKGVPDRLMLPADVTRFQADFNAKDPTSRVTWISTFNKDAAGGFTFEYWVPLDQALSRVIAARYPNLLK